MISVDLFAEKQYMPEANIVHRLMKRAEIRRNIPERRSVQEGKPDRLSDLLDEAAHHILSLEQQIAEESAAAEYWENKYNSIT